MPRPVDARSTYVPGLDGVRALAVLLVLGYHTGLAGFSGGLLGVGVFFTLSGYLITGILLTNWQRTGRLQLGDFWLHRARRLVPAMAMTVVVVVLVTALADASHLAQRLRESLGAMLYVSNWQTILSGRSYFDRFAAPGPLDHLWSLAIEEQFYLAWPLVLWLLLRLCRGRSRPVLAAVVALAGLSFIAMALFAHPGFDHTRVYEGTDTRAGGLLVGAALAMVWRPGRLRGGARFSQRLALDATAVFALALIGWQVRHTTDYSMSLYRGGMLVLSLATAAVVGVAVHPSSWVGRLLGVAPLRWLGERSYGVYLWHMPVVVFTPAAFLQSLPVLRAATQIAGSIALAALSWSRVEDPIRRFGLHAVRVHRATPSISTPSTSTVPTRVAQSRRVPLGAATVGALTVALVATITLAIPARFNRASAAQPSHELGIDLPPLPPDVASAAADASAQSTADPVPRPATVSGRGARSAAAVPGRVMSTSCTTLVHVGDSTSIGLVDAGYQPVARDRIPAQYARVGVVNLQTDISGARSIVETWHGLPNAQQAVSSRMDRGYQGCWVMAMGTNEAANQFVGGSYPLDERIDLIMKLVKGQPILWLTTRTLLTSGPYADSGARAWDAALVKACQRYPNMRVYDWRSEVQRAWYIFDGIHFTTAGYAERARRIANALAIAFPRSGPPASGCVVSSGSTPGLR